jgi:putative N-acetylmannosamine-6-phosphate epimerase
MEVKPEVLEAVKKAAPEGRISCPVARKIAEEQGVSPLMVGTACNQLKIKIKGCELGCFK